MLRTIDCLCNEWRYLLAVIGLCGGEVELSGVRTVSLNMFHLGAGDGSCGCWFCLGVCFVLFWLVGVFALLVFGFGFSTVHHLLLHT